MSTISQNAFSDIFPKQLGIFGLNYTCLLNIHIYARVQIFVQLSPTMTVNFGPLQTLIANISGMGQHIQNRKDVRTREIRPAFNEKNPVNFGPLTAWNYM